MLRKIRDPGSLGRLAEVRPKHHSSLRWEEGRSPRPPSQGGKRKWVQMQTCATSTANRQGLWSNGLCFSVREDPLLRAEVGEQKGRYNVIITRCEKASTRENFWGYGAALSVPM